MVLPMFLTTGGLADPPLAMSTKKIRLSKVLGAIWLYRVYLAPFPGIYVFFSLQAYVRENGN